MATRFFSLAVGKEMAVERNVWPAQRTACVKAFTLIVPVIKPSVLTVYLHWRFALSNRQCKGHLHWRLGYVNGWCKWTLTLAILLCEPPVIICFTVADFF